MKKLAIYPFIYEHRELIMYSDYMKNYQLAACVTLNKVETECFMREFKGLPEIIISEEFEKAIKVCDTVLCLFSSDILLKKEKYIEKIEQALQSGKEILLSRECNDYLGLEKKDGISILGKYDGNGYISETKQVEYIRNIEIPAIGIMGLGRFCNKFCTESEVYEFFRKSGYKILHFGSKEYVPLYGGKLIPEFVFDRSIPVTTRIIKWNQYLFDTCNREQPDLVIVGMPGGIMPLNNKILNDYGEIPFILSSGIKIDVGILCSFFYDQVDEKYFNEYKNYCKYKMNCSADFIVMSNSSCRFNLDSQESILEYLHYENDISNNTIIMGKEKNPLRVYNILDTNGREKLLSEIYDQLTSGVSAF